MAIFEALIWRLKIHHPRITEVYVQSDNASAYQNGSILFDFQMVMKNTGITLLGVVHTETQDGKGIIDAHFSTANKHAERYVNEGNDIKNEIDLVKGLRSNGGVGNTVVELLYINREKLCSYYAKFERARNYCNTSGRYNEATFKYDGIIVQEYSHIARCIILRYDKIGTSREVSNTGVTDLASEDESDAYAFAVQEINFDENQISEIQVAEDDQDNIQAFDFDNPVFVSRYTGAELYDSPSPHYRPRSCRRGRDSGRVRKCPEGENKHTYLL